MNKKGTSLVLTVTGDTLVDGESGRRTVKPCPRTATKMSLAQLAPHRALKRHWKGCPRPDASGQPQRTGAASLTAATRLPCWRQRAVPPEVEPAVTRAVKKVVGKRNAPCAGLTPAIADLRQKVANGRS